MMLWAASNWLCFIGCARTREILRAHQNRLLARANSAIVSQKHVAQRPGVSERGHLSVEAPASSRATRKSVVCDQRAEKEIRQD